jgi:hypothetical protein
MTEPTVKTEEVQDSSAIQAVKDLWQRSEPRSLINIVPNVAAESFISASKEDPHLFGHDEEGLHKILKATGAIPSATDNRLRVAFWMEYERAQVAGSQMELRNVYSGVCSKPYFYQTYLNNSAKVAWLTCQISSYEKYADEAITFGLTQLREVLALPHAEFHEDGSVKKIDTKLIELKAKIIFGLEARRKGAVVQRVEQKNMNLSITATDKQAAQLAMEGTMEQLEKRLEDIRKRQRKARAEIQHLESEASPEVIEVKSETVEIDP